RPLYCRPLQILRLNYLLPKLLYKLEGKLLRGVNLSQREREFVKALCGGLYNEWLEAIWWQAKKVLEKIKP
ncbi:hypothetical protein FocTR4_00004219, partial [Fusarium oxysporum f. sp. cubense]